MPHPTVVAKDDEATKDGQDGAFAAPVSTVGSASADAAAAAADEHKNTTPEQGSTPHDLGKHDAKEMNTLQKSLSGLKIGQSESMDARKTRGTWRRMKSRTKSVRDSIRHRFASAS